MYVSLVLAVSLLVSDYLAFEKLKVLVLNARGATTGYAVLIGFVVAVMGYAHVHLIHEILRHWSLNRRKVARSTSQASRRTTVSQRADQ